MANWNKLAYPLFYDRFIELFNEVKELKKKNPENYKSHKKAKMFACVLRSVITVVPTDPTSSKFHLGNTLGKKHRSWKRVKDGLPRRYRLFFRYMLSEKTIIYTWLNDEYTIRKAGGKKDVYRFFRKMLENDTIPNNYQELKKQSKSLPGS